ncbi:MAG: Ig-like domain repeat protein [Arachnia sp.]
MREAVRSWRRGLAIAIAVVLVGGMGGGAPTARADSGDLDSVTPVTVSGESYGPEGFPAKAFSVSAPAAMVKGKPIVITGTGYLATDLKTGSVANFMIDAERSGDPNTLYTTRTIINPVTGKAFTDKRSHGIVQAKADGTWRIEIPWPNETNTTANGTQAPRDAAFFAANWKAGTTHSVRILSGSLLSTPADYQRGVSVNFTVVDKAVGPVAKNPKIDLARTTVEQGDHAWFDLSAQTPGSTVTAELITAADAAVARASFEIGADGRPRNLDGQTYQRVTVPRTAAPGQYRVRVTSGGATRVTSAAFAVTAASTRVYNPGDHAHGAEDLLVQQSGSWTFRATNFTPNGVLRATATIGGSTKTLSGIGQISATDLGWRLDAKGDAGLADYVRVQLPSNVTPGPLEVTFSDGTKTVRRTLTVEPPVVAASVVVAPSAALAGTVRITGKGFLHPTNASQGSRIAVKIDDGGISRLDSSAVHANKTIWFIIDAKKDGTFDVAMPLPNGTGADDAAAKTFGSAPALTTGTHTLRFLTGSLIDGDVSRTLKSSSFTVTAAAPKKLTSTPTPAVSGTAKVGSKLTVKVGTWQPAPVKVGYQWLRDGKAISKATKSSYTVTGSDAGKKISVKVTGSRSGYVSVSRTSKSVSVAKVKASVKVSVPSSVKRGKQATVKVAVSSAATGKPVGTVKVTVNGKTVKKSVSSSVKGKVSVTLPKVSKKGTYSVKVSFVPSGSTAKSTSSSSTVTKKLKVT